MAYTERSVGPRSMRPPMAYPEDEIYEDDPYLEERKPKKELTPEEKEAKKAKKKLKEAKEADKKRTADLSKKNKGIDSNSRKWRQKVKIEDDQFVPEGRFRPKDDARVKEEGIVIRRPDMENAEVCRGLDLDSRRGQKKCVAKMRAQYRKEHEIVYTSACAGVTGYFAKKRCIKKYNRGL